MVHAKSDISTKETELYKTNLRDGAGHCFQLQCPITPSFLVAINLFNRKRLIVINEQTNTVQNFDVDQITFQM